MFYQVRTKKGKILSTNLPNELKERALKFDSDFETSICDVKKKKKREGVIKDDNLILYLCSYEETKTNKIFKHQLEASVWFLKVYQDYYRNELEEERRKTRRLKHNISTYTSKIHQELYKLLPQEKISSGNINQREYVKEVLEKNHEHAVTTILRILKNSNLIKSEFDVHNIMHHANPHIDMQSHQIHKVVTLSLSSFWIDLTGKDITVNLNGLEGEMYFDYKSMSSILCHVFDNATKYVAGSSEFKIYTEEEAHYSYLTFDMISLRVNEDELSKIFKDGFSSIYSEKLGYAGTGVGMNVIKKLCEINNFTLSFERNVDPDKTVKRMKIPFDNNILRIGIPK